MFLTIAGIDSHGRPVYEDFFGHYWKDTNPDPDKAPKIVSALDDAFDGEPDIPYHGEVCFSPCRVTFVNKGAGETFQV